MLASIQSQMRIRDKAKDCFGDVAALDPAWQILLYMYSNSPLESDALLSNLKQKLGVPETALKRSLLYVESRGFVLRASNGDTKAGGSIFLSEQAQAMMEEVFANA